MLSDNELKKHAAAYERRQAIRKAKATTATRSMSKAELVKLAESAGMTVTRADGGDGEPTLKDYHRAFGL